MYTQISIPYTCMSICIRKLLEYGIVLTFNMTDLINTMHNVIHRAVTNNKKERYPPSQNL